VAVIEDDEGARPYLFRSYNHLPHPRRSTVLNPDRASNILIAKVARAITAAPSYFQHANLRGEKFVDGGLGNNNPSWIAYSEVTEMHELHRQRWRAANQIVGQTPTTNPEQQLNAVGVLVSIGTGKAKPAKLIGRAGVSRYLGYIRLTRQMATDSERTHQLMVDRISNRPDTHYYRFNVPTGLEDIKLDEWKTSKNPQGCTIHDTLLKIQEETNNYLQNPEVKEQIGDCAVRLVELRRATNQGAQPPPRGQN
jgi:Patatin-like phospholipase